MAKKNTPVITHTQIICYAILHLEHEIDDMRKRCEGKGPGIEAILDAFIAEQTPKLEALKDMYRFETGTEYI